MAKKSARKALEPFDKYAYYLRSVQSPETDAEWLFKAYKELKGKKPKTMREDFCAAFALTCAWVKYREGLQGVAVDLDPEPLKYGKKHYLSELNREQQKAVTVVKGDVRDPKLPKADIINALNFSYFIFKKRHDLKTYLKACYKGLNKNGMMVMDCFGGGECQSANVNETEHEDFSYFWDQDNFDPVSHEAMFYIHFKRKGEKKREKVFTYDWRLWTIPEIRELMEEVGFRKSHVYWEGTAANGEGDGEFTRVTKGEECESWIAYIVGEK